MTGRNAPRPAEPRPLLLGAVPAEADEHEAELP